MLLRFNGLGPYKYGQNIGSAYVYLTLESVLHVVGGRDTEGFHQN
jgi:hypothetical protein